MGSQYGLFAQPQGNIYIVNNQYEISTLPINGNLTAALDPQRNVLYLKAYQNGAPVISTYQITPFKEEDRVDRLEKKIDELFEKLNSKGGIKNELLSSQNRQIHFRSTNQHNLAPQRNGDK